MANWAASVAASAMALASGRASAQPRPAGADAGRDASSPPSDAAAPRAAAPEPLAPSTAPPDTAPPNSAAPNATAAPNSSAPNSAAPNSAPPPAAPGPAAAPTATAPASPASASRAPASGAPARAAPAPTAPTGAAASSNTASTTQTGQVRPSGRATVVLSGYVEAFYSINFNFPSNGITNERGFDNRHNTFTISNAVLDLTFSWASVSGRIAGQVGTTPEAVYLGEPSMMGTSSVGASNNNVWKFLQQANLGWRAPLGRGLLIEAGLFLSPVGVENMAVRDNWNWSRSNLFFGLPFYHAGVRLAYPVTDRITVSLMGCNGWNTVVDNNPEKSVTAQFQYSVPDRVSISALYFAGVERNVGAAEGRPWRHLFDTTVTVHPLRWLSLAAQANAGFESGNVLGTPVWAAAALYARFRLVDVLFVALRGDFFYEGVPATQMGMPAPTPIFWSGSPWVSSGTATLDFRPIDHVLMRLEYRHDQSGAPLYFRDAVMTDGTGAYVTNATSQDTLTAGMSAWF